MLELRRRYGSSAGGGQPSRLPAGYKEVEYIESTGTQYIDTKYNPFTKYDIVSIHVKYKANRDSFWILGSVNTKDYIDDLGISSNAQRIYGYAAFNVLDNSGVNEIILTRNEVSINGQKHPLEYQGNQFYEKRDLLLFKANGSTMPPSGLIYYCKIVTESVTYEFIPCRRLADNEKGMYDIVNNVFYVNQGTGEFLVGADVGVNTILPIEYQQVEYLKSAGSQYIDTGIILKQGCRIEIKYQILDTSSTSWLFVCGARDNLQTRIELTYNHSKTDYAFIYGTSIIVLPLDKINDNTILICDYEKLTLNDIEYSVNTSSFNIQSMFYLFNCNQGLGTGLATAASCIIEYVKITNNGVDYAFYPCYRKEDNVAGMYDIVNNVFYTNAGIGEFIVGPLVI